MKKLEKLANVAKVTVKTVKFAAALGFVGTIVATGAVTGGYVGCKIVDKIICPMFIKDWKEVMK